MTELPKAARDVLQDARAAHDPSHAQVERTLASLHARLGALPPASAPTGGGAHGGLLGAKLLKWALALAAVGGMVGVMWPRWNEAAGAGGTAVVLPPPAASPDIRRDAAAAAAPSQQGARAEGFGDSALGSGTASPNDLRTRATSRESRSAGAKLGVEAVSGDASASRGGHAKMDSAADSGETIRAARAGATSVSSGSASASRAVKTDSASASGGAVRVARGANPKAAAAAAAGVSRIVSTQVDPSASAPRVAGARTAAESVRDESASASRVAESYVVAPAIGGVVAVRPASDAPVDSPKPTASVSGARRGADAPAEPSKRSGASSESASVAAMSGTSRGAPARPTASDADELALIDRAASRLRDGDHVGALALLMEHGKRYPASQLRIERQGLRVLALCGAGDIEQARRERTTFLRSAPQAPLATRVRRACAEPVTR